jgi:hypothetical protein
VLESEKARVGVERNSRKEPLSDAEARRLLASVKTVTVARGKKAVVKKASETTLGDLRGPTGGFRAPIVRKGSALLVGFSDQELRRLLL